jgi:hypothetical protein
MHARLAAKRARMQVAPAWAAWTIACAGCHTAHALAVNTSGAQFYRVFTDAGVVATPGPGCNPLQARVDQISQRQRPARATAVGRVMPNLRGVATLTARLQDLLHSPLRWVHSGEHGRVNFRERQEAASVIAGSDAKYALSGVFPP